ncbi:twin-arginine translocase TatA/TatE family subunit [Sanguibacter sp. HDW7]|uniref:twin-arginine translocase TatA/TatE family subunit n=1 Tax=Sanguibacter sp. HDW7 TaxID=2714931 RepID=UPI00140B2EB3|nr:twin-arginine translocase TatA/TatE family subunit [Sanguibacter sp. HDW7]QIK83515.1 twin-arginine translocase TatA/TatE family subunit [Sanguibacter sp. HDW7]
MFLKDHPLAIVVILLLILLLFGSSKLPDLARNLGRSMRIVKKEVREMRADDDTAAPSAPTTPQTPADQAGDDAPKA